MLAGMGGMLGSRALPGIVPGHGSRDVALQRLQQQGPGSMIPGMGALGMRLGEGPMGDPGYHEVRKSLIIRMHIRCLTCNQGRCLNVTLVVRSASFPTSWHCGRVHSGELGHEHPWQQHRYIHTPQWPGVFSCSPVSKRPVLWA